MINFKLDTGTHCNVILPSALKSIKHVKLQRSRMHLITYSEHTIQPVGQCILLCEHMQESCKNFYYTLSFQVTEGTNKPLLGLKACTTQGLIKRVDVMNSSPKTEVQEKNKDVFTGLGYLPGKVSLKVKFHSIPVVHPPRKLPIAYRNDMKEELKRMKK
ncbi:hypothetical protein HOLleu_18897 [Holothuria leucospilota]|uniref:Uncharacterized protein n=1 Tax=Holothuria leucospilota TaxID=206669 RepID=A0A9Q1H707_HOLLE|nr:hypothetical protein HOLleu_18897 [Holothuria leucospilota]